jgi:hypothetical protein
MQRLRTGASNFVSRLSGMTAAERLCCLLVGLLGGMFPVPMLTTVVTAFLSKFTSLPGPQMAVAMTINVVIAPVELVAIPPLARFGALLTGANASQFTAAFLLAAIDQGPRELFYAAQGMLLHAILTWALFAVVGLVIVRLISSADSEKKSDDQKL